MKIYMSRVMRNFTEPQTNFCRINYDFSKLLKNLSRKSSISFLRKCKGKIVITNPPTVEMSKKGENILFDIILGNMILIIIS